MPNITTTSIAIVPRSDRKNFPITPDIVLLLATMFLISPAIAKIHASPTARIKIHQNTAATVESPTTNSMRLTCSPWYVTVMTPEIAENICIIPSMSCNSHRNNCKTSSCKNISISRLPSKVRGDYIAAPTPVQFIFNLPKPTDR